MIEPEKFNLGSLFGGIAKVRLRGGVVGKVSTVLICACASMALIAWASRSEWIAMAALLFVFCLCFPMLWRLISFADKNPQAALFEGAEFLAHEKMKLGSKSHPVITEIETTVKSPDKVVSIDNSKTAALPDSGAEIS